MSEIVKITTHADDAAARLPEQYKGMPKMTALARISGDRAQALENAIFGLISLSSIQNAFGALLDQIGDVVVQPREGLDDPLYRIRIIAKIAQNVSNGTAEELIFIYKLLMSSNRVYYNPVYPAGLSLTSIGSLPGGSTPENAFSFDEDPDPSGMGFGDATDLSVGGTFASAGGFSAALLAEIRNAVEAAALGGVSVDFLSTVDPVSFSFSDDPDPDGAGFGDATDSSVGGVLAELI